VAGFVSLKQRQKKYSSKSGINNIGGWRDPLATPFLVLNIYELVLTQFEVGRGWG